MATTSRQSNGDCPWPAKRKKIVLNIEQKLEVIDLLQKGASYSTVADKYGIGRSTIADIRKSAEKLRSFKQRMTEMGVKDVKVKAMKIGAHEKLDEGLYIWFRQQREKDVPVTGVLLQEKAKLLYERLYPDATTPFSASTGFRSRFMKRHNLRCISILGEPSGGIISACEFRHDFEAVVGGYDTEQLFNCDETGLQFRLLPERILTCAFETSAEGRRRLKDRVTISVCANATGTIKLPLLLIGKAARPRCFAGVDMKNLPVVYKAQRNAWVNVAIFSEWFHEHFVPHVQEKLTERGKEPRALLVLDNCSAHPDQDLLISRDGQVKAVFLPPSVSALIQPMDQGVLESLKRCYRKSLLRDLLLSGEDLDVVQFLKAVNLRTVVEKAAIAWACIGTDTIRRSWGKLVQLPTSESSLTTEEETPATSQSDAVEIAGFLTDFQQMGHDLTEQDIRDWLWADSDDLGYEHLDDDSLVNHVAGSSNDEVDGDNESDDGDPSEISTTEPAISHMDAMEMFDKCLCWLQCQPEATPHHTSVLLSLKEVAANKRFEALRQHDLTS